MVRQISLLPAVHRVVVLGTLCALELRAEGSNAGYAVYSTFLEIRSYCIRFHCQRSDCLNREILMLTLNTILKWCSIYKLWHWAPFKNHLEAYLRHIWLSRDCFFDMYNSLVIACISEHNLHVGFICLPKGEHWSDNFWSMMKKLVYDFANTLKSNCILFFWFAGKSKCGWISIADVRIHTELDGEYICYGYCFPSTTLYSCLAHPLCYSINKITLRSQKRTSIWSLSLKNQWLFIWFVDQCLYIWFVVQAYD